MIPDAVRQRQAEASDPSVSAFVAANAGSGKTHVLAQRVIRLLLHGVDPSRILCITFTKAAAANMASRIFDTLRGWIACDDAALDEALGKLGVGTVTREARLLARRLFAAALETPGGLKVQTIHAFCTRLMQQFPFEARVAARFVVLDERASVELLDQATLHVLLAASAEPNSTRGRALATAVAAAADTVFRDLVRETIGRREALTAFIETAGGVQAAIGQLSAALGLTPDDSLERIETAMVEGSILPSSAWPALAEICFSGSRTDCEQGRRLKSAAAASGAARVDGYLTVFFTAEFEPRRTILTKGLAQRHPALAERLGEEQARLATLRERRNAAVCRDRTAALLTIAHAVIERYRRSKEVRGLLDFDDLIEKTLAMLASVTPTWVHYKLDLGIDHVLIDEAQDTSASQWEIIRRLVAEFTAGAGARSVRRSIFAVGDEKQSIFSFQGAAPREFARMRRHFQSAHAASGMAFVARAFTHSFRSGASVLGAVDEVFRAREVYASVTSDADGVPPHDALPDRASGRVEIWPLVKAAPGDEIEGWQAPFDALPETSPQVVLAQKIARTVRAGIGREMVASTGRPLRPGDVLVLVRQRGPLFEAIIRALKEADVAVAGADRLVLTDHAAIIDLMALADAVLLADDDLALAIALKSPLFGFDDDLLFRLASGRAGSLRAALESRAGDEPAFAQAAARVHRCIAAAGRETPFSFYAWLLGAEGGRARMLARLGPEAADALDEFLELALDYERRETPSLQGFVAWLRAAESEIKRDMEMTRDEVRVMTVHGAKGLEAPVVFLADTTTPPSGSHQPRLLSLPVSPSPHAPEGVVWAGRKHADPAAVADARRRALAEAEDEHRRLLYVAMTRAADRLVICGYEGKSKRRAGCWYDLVMNGLVGKPGLVAEPGPDGDIHVFRKDLDEAPPAVAPALETRPAVELPDWLRRPVAAEADRTAPLSPSRAAETADARASGGSQAREAALLRGRLTHRLLQSLPEVAPERRAAAAEGFLARAAPGLDPHERERLVRACLAVLTHPACRPLFAAGSRAEAPIVGRIHRTGRAPIVVSGQVDRFVVTPEAVLLADYKTDRPAPADLADVSPSYVTQLALYRAVLGKLYPDRPVHAVLVWTDGPDVMTVPGAALDAALARLTSA